jgi:hypothetical protein
MRVFQEFYCASSGGGCGGYITVRLNMKLNGVVEVICPKCGHPHQRCLKNGVLMEQGRHSSSPTQELCPTLAAWHKEPTLKVEGFRPERDAVVGVEESRGKGIRPFLAELWHERFGGR